MAITKVNHPDLLDLASDTGATVFPKGTTAQRPVSPEAGYIRFNTTDNVMETYDGTEWKVLDTIIPPYSVDYLVIAGGGGGGCLGSGAGAGGYRNSYATELSGGGSVSETSLALTPGTLYGVTVGAGGSGAPAAPYVMPAGSTLPTSGSNSIFSTITSIGGGMGTQYNSRGGASGGSGGGAGSENGITGFSGTTGQGYKGGDRISGASSFNSAGGGGAGAVGGNASGNIPGNGGNGLASAITGTSITRAGGGGSGTWTDNLGYPGGTGGSGGGGNGAGDGSTPGSAGVANTGSGGGAGGFDFYFPAGGNGGSGVVILRIPTVNYSGTTTGSPTVTTDGSDTILTYTSSGTYTA